MTSHMALPLSQTVNWFSPVELGSIQPSISHSLATTITDNWTKASEQVARLALRSTTTARGTASLSKGTARLCWPAYPLPPAVTSTSQSCVISADLCSLGTDDASGGSTLKQPVA